MGVVVAVERSRGAGFLHGPRRIVFSGGYQSRQADVGDALVELSRGKTGVAAVAVIIRTEELVVGVIVLRV